MNLRLDRMDLNFYQLFFINTFFINIIIGLKIIIIKNKE